MAQIRCGENHTMILTVSGSVWVWGANDHGQLGLGETQEEVRRNSHDGKNYEQNDDNDDSDDKNDNSD